MARTSKAAPSKRQKAAKVETKKTTARQPKATKKSNPRAGRVSRVDDGKVQMRIHVPNWVLGNLDKIEGSSVPDKLSKLLVAGAKVVHRQTETAALLDFCRGEGKGLTGAKQFAAILEQFESARLKEVLPC